MDLKRICDKVNIMVADAEMAMSVRNWTESKACTHLHKLGPPQHKNCAFLRVGVLVLS